MSEEKKDFYCILDGYGKMVYWTHDESKKDFWGMLPQYYNLDRCEIIKNPPMFDPNKMNGCQVCERNLETGEIVVRCLERQENKTYWTFPHIPAP